MKLRLLTLVLLVSVSGFSQTKKIRDIEDRRKQIMRDIENTSKLLKETTRTTTTLLSRINMVSSQIASRQKYVKLLEEEVAALTEEQAKTEQDIVILEGELKEKQQSYAKAIKGMMYKKQNQNHFLYILSGKSLSESFRRFMYLKDYSDWRSKQADNIKKQKDELNVKRAFLAKAKSDKVALLKMRELEELKLKEEEKVYQVEIAEANKQQKELKAILSEKQKQANALNAQVAKLIAEETARQQKEAKRLAEEERKKEKEREKQKSKAKPIPNKSTSPTETKEKPTPEKAPVLTPPANETRESFALSSNFAANKGRFPMPLTGSCRIIGKFGVHQHSQYIATNSGGIDIQSQAGAQARAVFSGTVVNVLPIPGYNNCLIISHGSYYTFYGNIQSLFVKLGQKISAGQLLGKIYTDSDTGTSQMHFQLWKGTTKLNPEPWLNR